MTAPRIARASRSRFFVGLGIFIVTMGLVAMFHSSQQQLDEMRHMELRCEQQQEALSAQLEAVEKAARAERHEQQQFKRNLEREAREQTELKEKTVMDTNQKLSSLQQHYKLLKSQNDDFTEECGKAKTKQLAETKMLQDKIKTMQIQHGKEIANLKVNNAHNDELSAKDAEIDRLRKQIEGFNLHCAWRPEYNDHAIAAATSKKSNDKNFNAQIPVSANLYKIQLGTDNQTNDKQLKTNVNTNDNDNNNGDGSANVRIVKNSMAKTGADVIINSVENFQLVPNVNAIVRTSTATTTPTSRRKTSEATNGKLNEAPNAPMPDQLPRASSTTAASRKHNETMVRGRQLKPVPDGVVPIQSSFDEIMIQNLDQKVDAPNENNRYANVVDEAAAGDANNKQKQLDTDSMKKKLNELQNVNDNDNGAREVNDNNDFVVDERNHKDHMHDAMGHKSGGIKNAAEEDMNLYDNKFNLVKPNGNDADAHFHRADDDLTIQRGGGAGGSDDEDAKALNNDNKLLNEIDGDQGKVAYPDVLHIEEQLEDEDDDEYANPNARKQDPAVRHR